MSGLGGVQRFVLRAAFVLPEPEKFLESRGFRGPHEQAEGNEMAKRWYSVSVLSNFEKKIAEQIRAEAVEKGLQDQIEEVLVPEEEVIEIRRG